jgi:hypothetical protein
MGQKLIGRLWRKADIRRNEVLSADLAQRVVRQFVEDSETLRVLTGCKPRRDVAEDFGK